jgi:hypothetical protein
MKVLRLVAVLLIGHVAAGAFASEALFSAIAEHRERDALAMVEGVKVDLNARNASGETALHRAVETGLKRLAQALIARGADPQSRSKNGETALHLASPTCCSPPAPIRRRATPTANRRFSGRC